MLQYRPPDCLFDKFDGALKVCQSVIDERMNKDPKIQNIIDFSDYNFPCISWPSRKYMYRTRKTGKTKQA